MGDLGGRKGKEEIMYFYQNLIKLKKKYMPVAVSQESGNSHLPVKHNKSQKFILEYLFSSHTYISSLNKH